MGLVFFPLILTGSCLVICFGTDVDVLIMDASLPSNVLTQNGPFVIINVQTVPALVFELNLDIGEILVCGCLSATCPQRGQFIFVCPGHSNGLMIITIPN